MFNASNGSGNDVEDIPLEILESTTPMGTYGLPSVGERAPRVRDRRAELNEEIELEELEERLATLRRRRGERTPTASIQLEESEDGD